MENILLIVAALVILFLSLKAFFSPPKSNFYGKQLNPASQKVFGRTSGWRCFELHEERRTLSFFRNQMADRGVYPSEKGCCFG